MRAAVVSDIHGNLPALEAVLAEIDDATPDEIWCLGYLESLAPEGSREGTGLYHASPRDPVWEYVLTPEAAAGAFTEAPESLILVGHSHVALAFSLQDGRLSGDVAREGTAIELN